MVRAIVFGIVAGAAFQAWRNYPPDGPATAHGLWLVLLVAVVCAFLSGFGSALFWFRGGRAQSHATAQASARAAAASSSRSESSSSSVVNLAVVVPGAPTAGGAVSELPWFAGEKPAVTSDTLDGLDLDELVASDSGSESVEVVK